MTGRCRSGVDDALGWKMMGVDNAVASLTAPQKSRNVREGTRTRRPPPSHGKGGAGGVNMSTGSSGGRQRKGMCGKALLVTGL